jgi:tetratricopeptide (TPR) repeat protein
MKTITFYSYKGGVGRSLALSNIAKRLSEFGKKVCLIDFDIEAPSLHHKFKENLDSKSIKKGLVDYIHQYATLNKVPESITGYVTRINFDNKTNTPIDLIASGNVHSNEYWKKLFSIDWVNLFYKENSQGVAFFLDMKEKIKKELNPDFLLIDSRTGITEISGITMSILADEIVLLAAKNDENIEGLKQVTKTLLNPENNAFGRVPKINFVLSRIPYFLKPEEKFKEVLAKNDFLKRINTITGLSSKVEKVFIIHSDQNLELNEKFMIGYEHEKRHSSDISPIALDYLELFEELTLDKLSLEDKKKFNNVKEVESLIKLSKNKDNLSIRIELLKKARDLNPSSDEVFYNLSIAYSEEKNFDNALESINKALEFSPNNLQYLSFKGHYFEKLGKAQEASKILKKVLKIDEKCFVALVFITSLYQNLRKPESVLKYSLMIVEFFPENYLGYNSVANSLRLLGRYKEAFEYIYTALEIAPKNMFCNGTLAELYAEVGNKKEFYKNLELSFAFGLKSEALGKILQGDKVYKPYLRDPKFLSLLSKYNLEIDPEKYL